jgi:hypothetical protein
LKTARRIVGRQKEYYWRWLIAPFINVSAQKEQNEGILGFEGVV